MTNKIDEILNKYLCINTTYTTMSELKRVSFTIKTQARTALLAHFKSLVLTKREMVEIAEKTPCNIHMLHKYRQDVAQAIREAQEKKVADIERNIDND